MAGPGSWHCQGPARGALTRFRPSEMLMTASISSSLCKAKGLGGCGGLRDPGSPFPAPTEPPGADPGLAREPGARRGGGAEGCLWPCLGPCFGSRHIRNSTKPTGPLRHPKRALPGEGGQMLSRRRAGLPGEGVPLPPPCDSTAGLRYLRFSSVQGGAAAREVPRVPGRMHRHTSTPVSLQQSLTPASPSPPGSAAGGVQRRPQAGRNPRQRPS